MLVMEAFEGFDDKIQYDIIGHSGETDKIDFVKKGSPPKDNKERLDIIRVCYLQDSLNLFVYFLLIIFFIFTGDACSCSILLVWR